MSRSIALAYAVTGAALASAVIAITASTTGLFGGPEATTASASFGSAQPAFAAGVAGVSASQAGAPDAPGGGEGTAASSATIPGEPLRLRADHERSAHEWSEHGRRGEHDDD